MVDDKFDYFHPHLLGIIFEHLLPLMAMNSKDEELWIENGQEFIFSEDSPMNDHNMVKNAAIDLFKILSKTESMDGELYLYKITSFIEDALKTGINPRTGETITQSVKEYILRALEVISMQVMDESILLSLMESFLSEVVIPELKSDS